MKKILYQLKTFVFAFRGLRAFFRRESKAGIHLFAALMAIGMAWYLKITTTEWLLIIFAIGLVFVAELFNTIAELISDLIQPDYDKKVKDIKDMAAAAVLVAAIVAAIIGLVIFLPKLILLQQG
jgi:diacylglycerol kinase (ATP)